MALTYYSFPLRPEALIKGVDHSQCSIRKSISSFLHLLSTTYFGECSFDETFGNALWEVDFDNLTSNDKLRAVIESSLSESIATHEKRLEDVAIEIKLRQENVSKKGNYNQVRKLIEINISSKIKQTNEAYKFIESFYIAPMAF